MYVAIVATVLGLALLVWSADRFVFGAAATARRFGMPSLLIGMLVVGFGTSAPEMLVSAMAAARGSSGLALGNAYGSNITNIALILGLTAVMSPIAVRSNVLRRELPVLALVTLLACWQALDGEVSRYDALVLLAVFAGLMAWSVWQGFRRQSDRLGDRIDATMGDSTVSTRRALVWLIIGLLLLILSSRVLVWGATEIAGYFGISDLIIGLTVVAVGTSLPELASSVVAAIKGEHDIALGNILGSNLFNTLAVVGVAGTINPLTVGPSLLSRDMVVMGALTLSLFIVGYGFRGPGRINRVEGGLLLITYIGYTVLLARSASG